MKEPGFNTGGELTPWNWRAAKREQHAQWIARVESDAYRVVGFSGRCALRKCKLCAEENFKECRMAEMNRRTWL
jgi:hypothetical protein